MRRYTFGLLAAAAYIVLLVRWFHDPGLPTPDGFAVRSRAAWPFVLVASGLFAAWLHALDGRPREMLAELRLAWRLDRRDALLLGAILVIALAYQLPLFLHPYGALDADAVLHGIMAKHIAEGRPATPFVYETGYGGTFSTHVLSLLYAIAGTSVVGLLIVTRGFYLLFICAEFVMLRAAAGRFVASAVALALAFPPPALLGHLGYVEFPETLAFGAAAVALITARLAGRLTDDLWYGVAGLLTGIGFWTQPVILPVIGAACATVVILRGIAYSFRVGVRIATGFVIGVTPVFVGWGVDIPVFVSWLVRGDPDWESVVTTAESFRGLAWQGLVAAFGPVEGSETMPTVGSVLTVAVVGSALWAIASGWRTWQGSRESEAGSERIRAAVLMALGLGVLLHGATFVLSPFNQLVSPPRYLIPLYVGVPAVLALSLWSLPRQRFARGVVAVVMGAWMISGIPKSAEWMGFAIEGHDLRARSFPEIEAAGIRYCEAPYWDAYPLTFFTLERIICSSNGVVYDPYYRKIVDQHRVEGIGLPLMLARVGDEWLETQFEQARQNGLPHRRLETPAYHVLVFERIENGDRIAR